MRITKNAVCAVAVLSLLSLGLSQPALAQARDSFSFGSDASSYSFSNDLSVGGGGSSFDALSDSNVAGADDTTFDATGGSGNAFDTTNDSSWNPNSTIAAIAGGASLLALLFDHGSSGSSFSNPAGGRTLVGDTSQPVPELSSALPMGLCLLGLGMIASRSRKRLSTTPVTSNSPAL